MRIFACQDKQYIMEVKDFATFKTMIGQTFEPTEWITVTQEMINDFAKATLDFQWIHIDVERAKKESPFGGPIAHGFLSVSLLPEFIAKVATIKSAKMGVNYGMNKLRFPHPVPAGSRLRGHITLANVEAYGEEGNGIKTTWDAVLEIEGVKKPACVAQMVSLAFE